MIESVKILLAVLLAVVAVEYPAGEVPDKHRAEIAELAPLFVEVAQAGAIVSPEADAGILAAVSFYESRWWARGRDGDCSYTPGANPRRVCSAFGPMQLSTGARYWLPNVGPEWNGITVAELRDPRRNIEGAYDVLQFWHRRCGGNVAKALTAYKWGRCPHRPDYAGRRRCALAVAIAAELGAPAWTCGHERQPVHGHSARLARAAAEHGGR